MLDPRYLRYMSLEAHAAAERPAPTVNEADKGAARAAVVRSDAPADRPADHPADAA